MLWPKFISLLATAAPTAYFRKYDFVYWLGPDRGLFSIDSGWLAFKFDTEDRVLATRVVLENWFVLAHRLCFSPTPLTPFADL